MRKFHFNLIILTLSQSCHLSNLAPQDVTYGVPLGLPSTTTNFSPPPYSSTLLHLWVVDLSSRLIVNISQPWPPLPVLWHAVVVSVLMSGHWLAGYHYSIGIWVLSLWVTHQLTHYIVDWCLENIPTWPALLLFMMEETECQFKMYQQCHFLGIIIACSLHVDSMLEMYTCISPASDGDGTLLEWIPIELSEKSWQQRNSHDTICKHEMSGISMKYICRIQKYTCVIGM